jgi:hypothetical protein
LATVDGVGHVVAHAVETPIDTPAALVADVAAVAVGVNWSGFDTNGQRSL